MCNEHNNILTTTQWCTAEIIISLGDFLIQNDWVTEQLQQSTEGGIPPLHRSWLTIFVGVFKERGECETGREVDQSQFFLIFDIL